MPYERIPTDASFCDRVRHAEKVIGRALQIGMTNPPYLDEITDVVWVCNEQDVLVIANKAFVGLFTGGASPIGRSCESVFDKQTSAIARLSNELLRSGVRRLESDFLARGAGGELYTLHANFRPLEVVGVPGASTMGFAEPTLVDSDAPARTRLAVQELYTKFRGMSDRDRTICRMTAMGDSSRDIADRLGLTTRAVELRKQKAFAALGVAKSIELARRLTQLQERGLIDLGL